MFCHFTPPSLQCSEYFDVIGWWCWLILDISQPADSTFDLHVVAAVAGQNVATIWNSQNPEASSNIISHVECNDATVGLTHIGYIWLFSFLPFVACESVQEWWIELVSGTVKGHKKFHGPEFTLHFTAYGWKVWTECNLSRGARQMTGRILSAHPTITE